MAKPRVRATDPSESQEGLNRPAASENPRQRLLARVPMTERRLRLAGLSTAVLEGGDGPPIVLLHGPGQYAAKWLRVIPDLMTTHRVVAPDLPAHGATEPFDGPPDLNRMRAWVDDLIECTCPTPPVLVGHVLGGAIAARFASDHSERLGRLVLVDALGLGAFQPAPDFAQALTAFVTNPTEDTHDRLWSLCALDLETMRRRMGDRWEHIKAYNLDRARVPALGAAQHALMESYGMRAIPPADLSRIGVPTSLIWGRHDLATPLPVAQEASARYGWPLHVIENAATDSPLAQPEAFLEALRAALGTSDTATRVGHARGAWDRIAPGYDRTNTPTQMWLANEGLRRVGLRAGMQFLDVAAGSGALSIPAARLGARVLAIDQSPIMLELLRARAHKEGLTLETRLMDGQALELEDNAFDVAGSQFGVMLFPDMPKGIREMVRVVKPGGAVLAHAYGDPHRIDFLGFLILAIQSVRPDFNGPPLDPPPYEFQLADPERLRSEFTAAGLKHISVETITETTEFESGDALWDWIVWSNPIVETILGSLNLTNHERSLIKQSLDTIVRDRAGSSSVAKLTNPVHIGIGTK